MRPLHTSRRWVWLGGTALLVTALTAFAADSDDEAAGTRPEQRIRPTRAVVEATVDDALLLPMEQLKQTRVPGVTTDAFGVKSWYVPPPPPPPAPPPVPTAPPLPFNFLGKESRSDGTLTFFLAAHDRVYLVHEGDTIDATYHVDGIKNGQLALTYLPMQITQYLNTGEAQ